MAVQAGSRVGAAGPAPARASLLLLLATLALAARGDPNGGAAPLQQPHDSGMASSSGGGGTVGSSRGGGGAVGSSGRGGGTWPEGVRLALGEGPGEVTVMWSTRLPTAESCLQYAAAAVPHRAAQVPSSSGGGRVAAKGPFVGPLLPGQMARGGGGSGASDRRTTTKRLLLHAAKVALADAEPPGPAEVQTVCGGSAPFVEPATGQPSLQLHTVALRGLPPGQAVSYRCGSSGGGWSDWRALRAPRAPWQFRTDAPARLLIVGDLGLYNSRCWPYIEAEARGAAAGGNGGSGGSKQGGAAGAAGRSAGPASSDAASAPGQAGNSGAASSGAGRGGGSSVPPPAAYDALLHVGDIAYDLESLGGRRASLFLHMVEPAAARLPYLVAPGNHEWHANFSHYRALFAMPGRRSENLFYSLDVGPLHVLVYNTEVFFWPELFGEEHMRAQHEWMEADLKAASANRQRTPWILAAGHRPMYCVRAHGGQCSHEQEASRLGIPSFCPHNNPAACRPLRPPGSGGPAFPIEQLFRRYGVDLAVYGHVHDYERYWPVANHSLPTPAPDDPGAARPSNPWSGAPGGSRPGASGGSSSSSSLSLGRYVNPRATVHMTSGSGGNAEMRSGGEPPPRGLCRGSSPWCAFQSGFAPAPGQSYDYTYSRLEVFNASHLRWQQVSCLEGGRVVDEFWVEQAAHGPFA